VVKRSRVGTATGKVSQRKREPRKGVGSGQKAQEAQAKRVHRGKALPRNRNHVSVAGEHVLQEDKDRSAPSQAHTPGKCGRCLGKTFDVLDRRQVLVWYCGKCELTYDDC
jgi:hypothetical protein